MRIRPGPCEEMGLGGANSHIVQRRHRTRNTPAGALTGSTEPAAPRRSRSSLASTEWATCGSSRPGQKRSDQRAPRSPFTWTEYRACSSPLTASQLKTLKAPFLAKRPRPYSLPTGDHAPPAFQATVNDHVAEPSSCRSRPRTKRVRDGRKSVVPRLCPTPSADGGGGGICRQHNDVCRVRDGCVARHRPRRWRPYGDRGAR
jgi:hypothetical protein